MMRKANRREKLWPTDLSGGMIEFILEGLLKVDSFKTKPCDDLWNYTWYARKFLEALPFWEMQPDDQLVRSGATLTVGMGGGKTSELGPQVFAKAGEVYAIYFPKASQTGDLDLTSIRGTFRLRWYNPRKGIFEGSISTVEAGRWVAIGTPPADPTVDWTALVEKAGVGTGRNEAR